MVYGTYNYSSGAYKPTYNWGGHIANILKLKGTGVLHMITPQVDSRLLWIPTNYDLQGGRFFINMTSAAQVPIAPTYVQSLFSIHHNLSGCICNPLVGDVLHP
jgi:hypothetical protein